MDTPSGNSRNHRLLTRFVEIMWSGQLEALAEVLTEDVVHEMPQTNERTRGIPNLRAIYESGPDSADPSAMGTLEILGEEPRYLMSPTFTLIRVDGSGDHPVAVVRFDYGDGSRWWAVNFLHIRDGRIARIVQYWAPVFPAPEWRAPWVEPME